MTIEEKVNNIFKNILNIEDLQPETTIKELNIDSLDVVDIIMECEKQFKLTIPDSHSSQIKTIGDIYEYLHKHVKIKKQ